MQELLWALDEIDPEGFYEDPRWGTQVHSPQLNRALQDLAIATAYIP